MGELIGSVKGSLKLTFFFFSHGNGSVLFVRR
jgi:hypothetical protein